MTTKNNSGSSQPYGGKSAEEIERWYHMWMADHDRAEVATVNVLDMLKDFASQYAHHQPTTKAVLNELIEYFSQQLRLQRESNIQYTGQEAFADAIDVCKNAYKKNAASNPYRGIVMSRYLRR